jgi:hypothetical protein
VQAFAASRLTETYQAELGKPLAHRYGRIDDHREFDIRARVKVEYQPPGHLGSMGCAIPWVEFECSNLRCGGQSLDAVYLEIGRQQGLRQGLRSRPPSQSARGLAMRTPTPRRKKSESGRATLSGTVRRKPGLRQAVGVYPVNSTNRRSRSSQPSPSVMPRLY